MAEQPLSRDVQLCFILESSSSDEKLERRSARAGPQRVADGRSSPPLPDWREAHTILYPASQPVFSWLHSCSTPRRLVTHCRSQSATKTVRLCTHVSVAAK